MIVPSRNSCQSFVFRIRSRNRVFSARRCDCSPSVVSIWSNFVLVPGCHKILEASFFAKLCQLYLTGQLVEAQDFFLHPASSCLCRRRYQELYFFRFQLGQNLVVHRITGSSLLFFCRTELITPIRHCSVNTELIYRMNDLEQDFSVHQISVEVKGCFTFLLIQDSTTQGTDIFEFRMISFFEWLHQFVGCTLPLPFFECEKNFHTTSLPTLDPRMSNVFARISLCELGEKVLFLPLAPARRGDFGEVRLRDLPRLQIVRWPGVHWNTLRSQQMQDVATAQCSGEMGHRIRAEHQTKEPGGLQMRSVPEMSTSVWTSPRPEVTAVRIRQILTHQSSPGECASLGRCSRGLVSFTNVWVAVPFERELGTRQTALSDVAKGLSTSLRRSLRNFQGRSRQRKLSEPGTRREPET